MRDHQKDHKQPMRLHQGSSREKDDQIENFMEEKITIQNNQHFGQDQLWLKKVMPGFKLMNDIKSILVFASQKIFQIYCW